MQTYQRGRSGRREESSRQGCSCGEEREARSCVVERERRERRERRGVGRARRERETRRGARGGRGDSGARTTRSRRDEREALRGAERRGCLMRRHTHLSPEICAPPSRCAPHQQACLRPRRLCGLPQALPESGSVCTPAWTHLHNGAKRWQNRRKTYRFCTKSVHFRRCAGLVGAVRSAPPEGGGSGVRGGVIPLLHLRRS